MIFDGFYSSLQLNSEITRVKLCGQVNLEMNLKELYETDFYLWLESTADLLDKQCFTQLDLENLIKEIRDMGRNNKRELKNRLTVLLMHLLKCKFQPSRLSNSWRSTILEQRRQIDYLLEDSPSLKSYLIEMTDKCYQRARKDASRETNLKLSTFPLDIPFTVEQILDPDFFAES